MQNTQKNQSRIFSTMRTYTPLQNWVVFVLKKMYQKSASRQQKKGAQNEHPLPIL